MKAIHTSYDQLYPEPSKVGRKESVEERLHQEAASRLKKNHYLSSYLEDVALADCTFRPTINKGKGKEDMTPIHQRLADLQRQKQRRLRELRQAVEKEQSSVLTFQPQITRKSHQLAQQKQYQEGYSYPLSFEPKKQMNRSRSRSDGEEEEEERDRSREGYLVKSDVSSRLLNEGRKLARRKQELLYQREQELTETLEKPRMSEGSRKLVHKKPELREDFAARQRYYLKKSCEHQDAIYEEESNKFQHYFHPNTQASKSQQILKEKKPEYLLETPTEKAQRLSTVEAHILREKKALLTRKYYNSIHYPFQPEINYISKLFGRRHTVQDLYENQAAKVSKQVKQRQLEEELESECTFRPKINDYSKQLLGQKEESDEYQRLYAEYYQVQGYGEEEGEEVSDRQKADQHRSLSRDKARQTDVSQSSVLGRINLQQPERMFQEIQEQQMRKEMLRRDAIIAKEIEELQECTFQPQLQQNHSFLYEQSQSRGSGGGAAAAVEPVIIKGLNRHLELKQLSDRLKKEEQEREYNAFHVKNVEKYRRQEDGSTIVKSFDLRVNSPSRLQHRKYSVAQFQ